MENRYSADHHKQHRRPRFRLRVDRGLRFVRPAQLNRPQSASCTVARGGDVYCLALTSTECRHETPLPVLFSKQAHHRRLVPKSAASHTLHPSSLIQFSATIDTLAYTSG